MNDASTIISVGSVVFTLYGPCDDERRAREQALAEYRAVHLNYVRPHKEWRPPSQELW